MLYRTLIRSSLILVSSSELNSDDKTLLHFLCCPQVWVFSKFGRQNVTLHNVSDKPFDYALVVSYPFELESEAAGVISKNEEEVISLKLAPAAQNSRSILPLIKGFLSIYGLRVHFLWRILKI